MRESPPAVEVIDKVSAGFSRAEARLQRVQGPLHPRIDLAHREMGLPPNNQN